jgi:hypothetical protein
MTELYSRQYCTIVVKSLRSMRDFSACSGTHACMLDSRAVVITRVSINHKASKLKEKVASVYMIHAAMH